MKRTIYLVIALICTLNANAQFTQNEKQTNSTEVPTHYEVSLSSGETTADKTKSCACVWDKCNVFRKVYLVGSA